MHLRHGRAHVLGRDVEIDDAATAWRRDVGEFVSAPHLDTCSMLAAVLVRPMPKGVLLSQLAPICGYLCLNRTIERCVCTVC